MERYAQHGRELTGCKSPVRKRESVSRQYAKYFLLSEVQGEEGPQSVYVRPFASQISPLTFGVIQILRDFVTIFRTALVSIFGGRDCSSEHTVWTPQLLVVKSLLFIGE